MTDADRRYIASSQASLDRWYAARGSRTITLEDAIGFHREPPPGPACRRCRAEPAKRAPGGELLCALHFPAAVGA